MVFYGKEEKKQCHRGGEDHYALIPHGKVEFAKYSSFALIPASQLPK
jgi:hypothetical protein